MEFRAEQYPPGSDFCIDTVDAWSGFVHGFGDKTLNISLPTAQETWKRVDPSTRLLLLNQEHGKKIVKLTAPLSDAELESMIANPPVADAWIASLDVLTEQKLVCGIRTADCLPVILTSRNFVAVVHCGWRGAQAGLLVDVITQLARLGGPQKECQIAIGPGAQSGCYEIQNDVAQKLLGAYEFVNFPNSTDVDPPVVEREGKKFGALPNLLQAQAIFSGVKKDQTLVHTSCSISNSRYFSYRREKEQAGRQLSFVGPRIG